jgi:hypothetical protein
VKERKKKKKRILKFEVAAELTQGLMSVHCQSSNSNAVADYSRALVCDCAAVDVATAVKNCFLGASTKSR